ncbi:MAG: hypothetical protein HY372_04150, partial [Candidatus Andersenbacteria bacterium]|nr:hypothetical protein [Candidatus Andersenbacteria bacterium]
MRKRFMRKAEANLKLARRGVALAAAVWLTVIDPAAALAQAASTSSGQAVDASGNPTGAPGPTGAPACTGAGCEQGVGQGAGQGANQGAGQGGTTLEDLGGYYDEEGNAVLPDGVTDTRQGAGSGAGQGASNGIAATNSNTGTNSTNTTGVSSDSRTRTGINNSAADTTAADLVGLTGTNQHNKNTGSGGITSGNAGIGVTQVKNDNTATIGGTAGLSVTGHDGAHDGDLVLGFGASAGQLTGADGPRSVQAVNEATGADSTNSIDIATRTEELNEVQNDGLIRNLLDLAAVTGKNEASMNTGDTAIATGDANVAATLINLLNTTVINGDLWVAVADIFGNLNGNIVLPDLGGLASWLHNSEQLLVDAINEETGDGSTNAIDIDVRDETTTAVANEAKIVTKLEAEAITGQNEAWANTGGGFIETGDASVSASNISLANTTVEGGNWALVIVNALNAWLGFMVGEAGDVRALSQEETLREITARNSETGADSDNTVTVEDERERTLRVSNKAEIYNEVEASAISGQNEANRNTGRGEIATGDANVAVTTVNVANTTVIDGSLFIAVVNIFGDFLGDVLYGGQSLLAAAHSTGSGQAGTVDVGGENSETGAESDNSIDVDVSRRHETDIDNEAAVTTHLSANVDTGSNKANRNTLGGNIRTGDGVLALHSRALANLVGVTIGPALGLTVAGLNDTTGFDSRNTIRARLNDERVVAVDNDANVSTVFGGLANTGDNEASQNTIGGNIATGDAAAEVGIHNLLNRVVLALTGGGFAAGDVISIDADFINRLTGALSENANEAEAAYDFLADVTNRGLVDNVIDLLLNSGGNTANENTEGGNIVSGEGCVDGVIDNSVNTYALAGAGGMSLTMDNLAAVSNEADITVETGGNATNENTAAGAGLPRQ